MFCVCVLDFWLSVILVIMECECVQLTLIPDKQSECYRLFEMFTAYLWY